MDQYYVVKYHGPFGFIKPWTAVRDSETFSQQFLTPSIVEGMEKKLFPELLSQSGVITKIIRHRLNYQSVDVQKERTWSKGGFKAKWNKNQYKTNLAILDRGVLINPNLFLAFNSQEDALRAFDQHLCLCRNEDILLPESILEVNEQEFDSIDGFELHLGAHFENAFKVGHNRFNDANSMFGELKVYGNPIQATW